MKRDEYVVNNVLRILEILEENGDSISTASLLTIATEIHEACKKGRGDE